MHCFCIVDWFSEFNCQFSLTLWVALRSLNAEIDSWWPIWHEVCQIVKKRPLSLFLPVQLDK